MIFLFSLEKIIRYKRIEFIINLIRQSACLVFTPIWVDTYRKECFFLLSLEKSYVTNVQDN